MDLLNFDENHKTVKGQKRGVLTGILYLAPANESGFNTCPNASEGCKAVCLYNSGNAVIFKHVNKSRIAKTQWFFKDRAGFLAKLKREIDLAVIRAKAKGFQLAIRLNGTSDIPWENFFPMAEYKTVKFYDYTKSPIRMKKYVEGFMPINYSLTFSLSETNKDKALEVLANGGNVAMVFRTRKAEKMPKNYLGYKVSNGDRDDLRFLDKKNVIVGLTMKGSAQKDTSGFVQELKETVEVALDNRLAA
jgi:hypothetical protein